MRTTTKRKMPGENRKLNMLETKRRATDKKQKQQTRKKIQEKHSVDRNENHIACQTMANTCSREGRGGGWGLGVSVEKCFHFAEHPVIE